MTQEPIQIPIAAFDPHHWAKEVWNHPARFKMVCWHRRARKTTLGINKLVKEAAANTDRVFGYIAPTYKQAKSIVWRDPRMIKKYCPRNILKKELNETELYGEFKSGSILQVLGADEPDSLRGKDWAGVVLDEFAMMKQSVWEEILRPVLTANNGWAWFLFTPKGRNHAYHYWENVPNWARDRGEWARFYLNAEQSDIIAKESLEQAKAEMPDALYRQEFLCEFLEGEGQVFKGIRHCITGILQEPTPGGRYVIGVDLAKTVDFTVLVCIDVFSKRVVAFDRFNEVSWNLQKLRITDMAKKYNDALVIVDSTGVGDPIFEDLDRTGVKVEGFKFTAPSKRGLIERLILAIEQRLILFPNIATLVSELEAFSYEVLPTGFRYAAPEGMHDDCVIALGLAVSGLEGNLYRKDVDEHSKSLARETVEV